MLAAASVPPFRKERERMGQPLFFYSYISKGGATRQDDSNVRKRLFVTNRCGGVEPHRAARGNVAR
jgi:hypothetical protein